MNIASTGAAQIVVEHKCAEGLTLLGEALRLTCVVAVSYSPTTWRLQYHWRCRA